jgi:hypothetical protein
VVKILRLKVGDFVCKKAGVRPDRAFNRDLPESLDTYLEFITILF